MKTDSQNWWCDQQIPTERSDGNIEPTLWLLQQKSRFRQQTWWYHWRMMCIAAKEKVNFGHVLARNCHGDPIARHWTSVIKVWGPSRVELRTSILLGYPDAFPILGHPAIGVSRVSGALPGNHQLNGHCPMLPMHLGLRFSQLFHLRLVFFKGCILHDLWSLSPKRCSSLGSEIRYR